MLSVTFIQSQQAGDSGFNTTALITSHRQCYDEFHPVSYTDFKFGKERALVSEPESVPTNPLSWSIWKKVVIKKYCTPYQYTYVELLYLMFSLVYHELFAGL